MSLCILRRVCSSNRPLFPQATSVTIYYHSPYHVKSELISINFIIKRCVDYRHFYLFSREMPHAIFNLFLTLFNFQPLKDKYSIAYIKLSNYISPLYMAYSYEAKQGPQHIQLAQELTDTSFYLNSTVTTLRHEASELAVA